MRFRATSEILLILSFLTQCSHAFSRVYARTHAHHHPREKFTPLSGEQHAIVPVLLFTVAYMLFFYFLALLVKEVWNSPANRSPFVWVMPPPAAGLITAHPSGALSCIPTGWRRL